MSESVIWLIRIQFVQNSTLQGRGMFRSTIPKLFPIVQIAAQRSSSIVKYLANWFGSLRTRRYRNSIVGMILNQTWWRRLSALGGGGGRLWHWGLIRRGGGVAGARAIVASSVPGASRARCLCAIHSSRVPTTPHATSRYLTHHYIYSGRLHV